MANYWEAVMTSRLARRRALAASGAAVARIAALTVAGCGGRRKGAPESTAGGLVAGPAATTAPVESVSAPDSRTVVLKLKQPDYSALPQLASFDSFYVMPRESEGGFNPKTDVRGHGPWLLDVYEPSVRMVWKKNSDYYIGGR